MVTTGGDTGKGDDMTSNKFFFMCYLVYGNDILSAQILAVSLLGVGTVLRLQGMRGQWSND